MAVVKIPVKMHPVALAWRLATELAAGSHLKHAHQIQRTKVKRAARPATTAGCCNWNPYPSCLPARIISVSPQKTKELTTPNVKLPDLRCWRRLWCVGRTQSP